GFGFVLFVGAAPSWFLPFPPFCYGVFGVAALLFAVAFALNTPKPLPLWCWLLQSGLLTVFLSLMLFCFAPQLARKQNHAFFELLLSLGLGFPLFALLLPPTLHVSTDPIHKRWLTLFTLYLVSTPLNAAFLSPYTSDFIGLFVFLPPLLFAILASLGLKLTQLWDTSHPQYQMAFDLPGNPTPLPPTLEYQSPRTLLDVLTSRSLHWIAFFRKSLLFLLLLGIYNILFAFLSLAGFTPTPVWLLIRCTLWLCVFFYVWQGLRFQHAPPAQHIHPFLQQSHFALLLAFVTFLISLQFDLLQHMLQVKHTHFFFYLSVCTKSLSILPLFYIWLEQQRQKQDTSFFSTLLHPGPYLRAQIQSTVRHHKP
ncbi:MAG: hypothetical protein AAGJ35_11880, partial [Myxococcota bacterium]